jgi:hypothetical protein
MTRTLAVPLALMDEQSFVGRPFCLSDGLTLLTDQTNVWVRVSSPGHAALSRCNVAVTQLNRS